MVANRAQQFAARQRVGVVWEPLVTIRSPGEFRYDLDGAKSKISLR